MYIKACDPRPEHRGIQVMIDHIHISNFYNRAHQKVIVQLVSRLPFLKVQETRSINIYLNLARDRFLEITVNDGKSQEH